MTAKELEDGEVATFTKPRKPLKRDTFVHPILATFSDPQIAWIINRAGETQEGSLVGVLRYLVDKERGVR